MGVGSGIDRASEVADCGGFVLLVRRRWEFLALVSEVLFAYGLKRWVGEGWTTASKGTEGEMSICGEVVELDHMQIHKIR